MASNGLTLPISDMNSLSLCSKFPPKSWRPFLVFLSCPVPRAFSPSSPARCRVKVGATTVKEAQQKLKNDWVASLSCPPPRLAGDGGDSGGEWVIGIDPDTRGAVALLKGKSNSSDCSAEVYDSPSIPMLVGKSVRKRLDTKSIVELLRSFDAPIGTTVYIEQAIPCPQDGKLGWYSGGFGYGQWLGTLVALGFFVIPVSSRLWKKKFELLGSEFQKDDSRRIASTLFPSLSSSLKRKKDHGRAEALLIAAYGQGLKMESDPSIAMDELVS